MSTCTSLALFILHVMNITSELLRLSMTIAHVLKNM